MVLAIIYSGYFEVNLGCGSQYVERNRGHMRNWRGVYAPNLTSSLAL